MSDRSQLAGPRLRALLTTERPRPELIREHPAAWRLAVATVCFGAFMGQLDASIVTLTYPSLRTEFHTSLAGVEWVSLAYLLTLVAFLVPVGRLSDVHGRKLMYLYGFAIFTAASAACGLAPGLAALVGFRIVQAVGAALMQANSVALVTTSAPPGRMRAALGIQAAGQAIGLALGPTIGGALVATLGWRWVFLVNVPIGIVALVSGHYLLPRTRQCASTARIDPTGVLLLATATTSALLALSVASGLGLPGWTVAALAGLAVSSGWAFVRRQARHPNPLIDLRLLRTGRIGPGLLAGLCGYLVLFGPLVLVPVELAGHGGTPLATGLVLTALPVGFALAATTADRLLPPTWSDVRRSRTGAIGCLAALVLLALLPQQAAVLPYPLALLGLALGVFIPANNALVMKAVPATSAGTGGGMVNMTRGLGTAVGVAAVTLAFHLAPGGAGARTATLTLAAFAALALATTLPGRRPS
ncbi:MFS transporter [Kitasatospora sp. MAP5-34]|uniref:MFS transporter n=1 Tax=Kitasatospora sp. MAP5-34 TaxID=3035102 RepID=UPI002473D6D0|nr:MFS transporter [Kitasatospora sp. MAP5-34]MDH6577072.1 EmrB/QacA subfamily drug resistance transporter [Kitasatospora sp. MAP5-34]